MDAFRTHKGRAIVMAQDNISTDQIIPSREIKRVSKIGLADGLFANQRYLDAAKGGRMPDPEFVLNQPDGKRASILVAGANFGCGSSREHAVWALKEFGFRVVVAESFGTIFFDNCTANGVLPVILAPKDIETLMQPIAAGYNVQADLEAQCVKADGLSFSFALPDAKRDMLLNGLSPIDVTLADKTLIDAFIARDRGLRGWLYSKSRLNDGAGADRDGCL